MARLEDLSLEEISENTGIDFTKHYASKDFPDVPLPEGRELLTRSVSTVQPNQTKVLGYNSEITEGVKVLRVTGAWFSWTRNFWTFRSATVIEWVRGGRVGGEGWAEEERHYFQGELSEKDVLDYVELYQRIGRAKKVTVKGL